MNDADKNLDELLKTARTPVRSAGYWENFPKRVTAQLLAGSQPGPVSSFTLPRLWAYGLASVSAVLVLCLGLWMRNRTAAVQPDYAKLYQEINTLFPNQVRAIIVGHTGVSLDLSEKPDVPSSPPVRVDVCRHQQCLTYITFSGQSIRLNGETCDVLADAHGHVSVVGRDIVWTSADTMHRPEPYHIEAGLLGAQS
jgi:hypothetical protein